ncbi:MULTISPECIES: YciI family protein [Rhizobium]|uniref:Uncharacterized conserved protein n=1 Tax=Rhizobium miluonense TaxID=411945 RepID=A0A1C3VBJ9_9HYPH|nr:YciI family protein [Rhizobium miluonense]SCB25152.1 Uncharacterized conserved protein [Rhizobium miluonense]
MKYMALIYFAPDASPEFGPLMAAYQAANERFAKDGVLVAGDALEAASTATTVSVRDGRIETLDGPFAESKEQLGGFYIFDCANLDEAIRYAAMIPTATYGRVEVRPIRNYANKL